jgi:hypothetical protein
MCTTRRLKDKDDEDFLDLGMEEKYKKALKHYGHAKLQSVDHTNISSQDKYLNIHEKFPNLGKTLEQYLWAILILAGGIIMRKKRRLRNAVF